MSNINNGYMSASPAFDRYGNYAKAVDDEGYTVDALTKGLTKREAFAVAAMQGIAANGNIIQDSAVAKYAVKYADALLKELESTT